MRIGERGNVRSRGTQWELLSGVCVCVCVREREGL